MDRRHRLSHPSALIINRFLEVRQFNPDIMTISTFIAIANHYRTHSANKNRALSVAGHLAIKDAIILFDEECPICIENLQETAVRLPCDHYFHKSCVNEWLFTHNTCPVCRKNLDPIEDLI